MSVKHLSIEIDMDREMVKVKRSVHRRKRLWFRGIEWRTTERWTGWWRWSKRKSKEGVKLVNMAESMEEEENDLNRMKVWRVDWSWNWGAWASASSELAFWHWSNPHSWTTLASATYNTNPAGINSSQVFYQKKKQSILHITYYIYIT